MIVLVPAPAPSELPDVFPSPFEPTPHPLARRAADELVAALRRAQAEPGPHLVEAVVPPPA